MVDGGPVVFRFLEADSDAFEIEAEGLWDISTCWWTKERVDIIREQQSL